MSIFKISKKQLTKITDENQSISDETTVKAEQHEAFEKHIGAREAESPEPVSAEATAKPVDAANPDESTTMSAHAGKDIVVKIDGPVGKVFTDALNQMLAIEGFAAMINADELVKHAEHDESDHADIQIGVYSGSVDLLNTEEIVKISNEIIRHTNQDYIIAIEGVYGRTLTTESIRRLALLEDLAKNGGTRVFYTTDLALDHLRGKLK